MSAFVIKIYDDVVKVVNFKIDTRNLNPFELVLHLFNENGELSWGFITTATVIMEKITKTASQSHTTTCRDSRQVDGFFVQPSQKFFLS